MTANESTGTYEYRKIPFVTPPELGGPATLKQAPSVIIVGAGPIGLAAALDLAAKGVASIVLDAKDQVSDGSRAVCWAKRSLEICNRLGITDPMMERGIVWSVGKVFLGEDLLYQFNLQPEEGFEFPAFINLQQYYVEEYLIDRAEGNPLIDVRFQSEVTALETRADGVTVTVTTPDGDYTVSAGWMLACDGARSPVRKMMDLDFRGRVFEDRFLIADIKMKNNFPTERWLWYHPWFHNEGPSALLHRQADDVFRLDFQLSPDIDPDIETQPDRVRARCQKMLGEDADFDFEWISIYRFQGRRLENFRHGRVIYAGDSAHQVSPFGARGANSGLQDIDNLGWKLAAVLDGKAPESLLDTYCEERELAADENLRVTSRTTDFMSAKGPYPIAFREAALGLAKRYPFGPSLVNAGRLSVANHYPESKLNTPDQDDWQGGIAPGSPLLDAPIDKDAWLLSSLPSRFLCMVFGGAADARAIEADAAALAALEIPVETILISPNDDPDAARIDGLRHIVDREGKIAARMDGQPGSTFLIRPDHHVAGRWRSFDAGKVRAALARACCLKAVAAAENYKQAGE